MFFSLSKIFWVMISPLNLLGICFVLVIILSAIRQRIYTKILCFFSVIFLFFGVMPVGHDALTFLENRFPKPREMPGQVDGIILLGGAISTELSYARGETVVGHSGGRLLTFLQLAQKYPSAKLIVTGGSGSLLSQDIKEADYARELFESLGIEDGHILYERESRNTFENALFVRDLIGASASQTWIVITSAYHMPRSIGAFQQQGIYPIPYPTAYITDGEFYIYPRDFDILEQYRYLNLALKEYIGNAVYFIGQKSNSLMPGQHDSI
jgi:uncharacterized SAM-binding protein YcdF (DUF218 family)